MKTDLVLSFSPSCTRVGYVYCVCIVVIIVCFKVKLTKIHETRIEHVKSLNKGSNGTPKKYVGECFIGVPLALFNRLCSS